MISLVLLTLYALIRWYNSNESEHGKSAPPPENFLKRKPDIFFVSNGYVLTQSHFQYYSKLLKIPLNRRITPDVIRDCAMKRTALINKVFDEPYLVSSRDIRTAEAYLLDQCEYLTSYN